MVLRRGHFGLDLRRLFFDQRNQVVDDVAILEVDLSRASRSFDHDDVVRVSKNCKAFLDRRHAE